MILVLYVALLSGFVAGRPGGSYPVHRQDFFRKQPTSPIPYQAYSYQDGRYRVNRQEFGCPSCVYSTSLGTLPLPDYGENQYWYPHTTSYEYPRYQTSPVLSPPHVSKAYMPKLFVPAPVPASNQPFIPLQTYHTSTDSILIPKSSVNDGDPLSALSVHNTNTLTTTHPSKYLSVNDDVEINDEQRDLLNSYHFTKTPMEAMEQNLHPRFRRYLDSTYTKNFKKQTDSRPLQPGMYFDVYQLYYGPVEESAENVRAHGEPDHYPSYRPLFDVEDRPVTAIENNEITDDNVAWMLSPYLPRALEHSIPRYPVDNSNDVVIVWSFPEESSIITTSETPTMNANGGWYEEEMQEDSPTMNANGEWYEEEMQEDFPTIGDRNDDSIIACEYRAETETQTLVFGTTEITDITTDSGEPPEGTVDELASTEPVFQDSSEFLNAIFGTSTNVPEMYTESSPSEYENLLRELELIFLQMDQEVDSIEQTTLAEIADELQNLEFIFGQISEIFNSTADETSLVKNTGAETVLAQEDKPRKVEYTITRITGSPTTAETSADCNSLDEVQYFEESRKCEPASEEAALSDDDTSWAISSPVPATENVNANDVSSEEEEKSLTFDIVQQEPEIIISRI